MSEKQVARSTRAQRIAWCFYDFGNSAYPTIIITAAYVTYFKAEVVGGDGGRGDALWGWANAIGALLVLLMAPPLGLLADRARRKRLFLSLHAWLCVAATAALAFTGKGDVALAMGLVALSLYAFEGANVFYNGFLPELVGEDEVERLGARGWAFGYAGGLLALLLVVVAMKVLGLPAWAIPLVVAAWFFGGTLPTLLLLRDAPAPVRATATSRDSGAPARRATLFAQLRELRKHPELARFLLALFVYMNGVNTIIVFAAAFSSQTLGFSNTENLILVMLLNLVAAPGALLFGRIATERGARKSIALSLWGWLLVVALAVTTTSVLTQGAARIAFWGVAALAALLIGATQATSRSFVGLLAPRGQSAEYYGFMALAGRASAILGTLVFGFVSQSVGQIAAVGSVGVFFALGLVLLRRVSTA